LGQAAAVVNDHIGAGDLLRLRWLRLNAQAGLGLAHPPPALEARQLLLRRAGNHPDGVAEVGKAAFHELDGVQHYHRLSGLRQQLGDAFQHGRMDDGLQSLQSRGIGEDQSAQFGAINLAIGPQDALPKLGDDAEPGWLAFGCDLMGDGVGVNDPRPQLCQHPAHGALAGGDIPRQANEVQVNLAASVGRIMASGLLR